MRHYPKYPEYRESGVEWIGEIPTHWKIRKNKYIFNERSDRSVTGTEELLTVSHITGVSPRAEKNVSMFLAETLEGYKHCSVGNLVINTMWAWMGALGISEFDGIVSPSYNVYQLKDGECLPRYYHYLYRTPSYVDEIIRWSKGIWHSRLRLYPDAFFSMSTITPPLREQKQIANFLDRKTKQIDELLRIKERMVELLQEQRTVLINQTVRKGLDPNVEMKPSGVEWIGEIPKGWEVKRIKYLASVISKGTTPTTIGREILDKGEIRFIKAENIVDYQIMRKPEYYIDEETNQMLKRSQLKESDILFVIAGTIGKVSLVKPNHLPANTNQAVSFIRPHEKEVPEFIYYWLQSDSIQKIIWMSVVQSVQPNLSMADLGNLYIPYPNIAEQLRIVDYLAAKTQTIAQLLQQTYKQIELLKEYRQTLISEVVTGKIDVQNEV